jgi:uncharacterized protein (TIGR02246 family)
MAPITAEEEVIKLEKQYWQAIKDKDADAAARLTDDQCVVAGAQGVARVGRDAVKGMMQAANYTLKDFDLKDVNVRMLGNDVALVAYKVHEELTVDGKGVTVDAADASTWVRRGDRWLCALHTESILGDPYGRDRRAAS